MLRDILQKNKYAFFAGIAIVAVVLGLINTFLIFSNTKTVRSVKHVFTLTDDDKKISEIEKYLDEISPEFIAEVKRLSEENKVPSWGCGPSSYALAKIINARFFNNKLPFVSAYNSKNHDIVERFSFAFKDSNGVKNSTLVDHAWLEIYFNNKFLFIDPTAGQFGRYDKIVYEVFNIEDKNIQKTLLDKYNIADIRLTLLVNKTVNRIPPSQDPYPGISLSRDTIDYFLKSVEERDEVNNGDEPPEWESWVSSLLDKFS